MTPLQILAIIITLATISGYVNHKYLHLPETIAHMGISLIVSIGILSLGLLGVIDIVYIVNMMERIDFSNALLHGMLAFLLFAGALHINLKELRAVQIPVTILATGGVIMATLITGTMIWYFAALLGIPLPYIYALLFGALISPTDPISVLAILKQAGVSKRLYVKIGGESLFNDGIGVVVFVTILDIALGNAQPTVWGVTEHFLHEALGGAILGGLLGWGTYRVMRTISDSILELLFTLTLASGGYALAEILGISAPICIVVAGLVIGNYGRAHGMSHRSRKRIDTFWELLDEVMNAVLFLLVGMVIFTITVNFNCLILGMGAVVAVLVGRYISVATPIALMRLTYTFERGTIRYLTWGGLRGGISIAMALSLPTGSEKDIILPITYIVVVFSILVQGLTFRKLIEVISAKQTNP